MPKSPWEEGYPTSKIAVLAEAPGRTEMRLGAPLVGPSGQVFADCLHAAGLARAQLYIINTFPTAVEKNKKTGDIWLEGQMLWHHKKGLTEAGMAEAQPTLDRLKRCGANVVLSMGQVATDLLMGDRKPITKWRGSILWSNEIEKKIVPTLHPAATIHGVYVWRYLIINEMNRAKEEAESPELNLPYRTLGIRPSMSDVMAWLDNCQKKGKFATDLEVINHQVSCFSLAYDEYAALTVPLLDEVGGHYWSELEECQIWQRYSEVMGDPGVMKVNQNIVGFDSPFLLERMNIFTRGPLGDPMIAQSIMYPDFNKGLDFIASVHTREPYWKDDGKVWKNPNISWDVFQRYCGRDACVALEAWNKLEQEMLDNGYMPTYDRTVRLAPALWYMMVKGLAVNKDAKDATKADIEKEIIAKEAELHMVCDRPLNVSSPKQCREYFYDHLGHKPYLNVAGGISTDDKAMARIVRKGEKGHKEAKLVQEIRSLKKLLSSYLDVELDPDNRLRCSWNPRGTWTGRLSSSQTLRGTGMNLQNLHPRFKSFIIAG